MTKIPQHSPAADLWSDYLDAATSWHDESGYDVHDIEGMNEAAHDIYLALVAAEAERDALAAALVTMGVNPASVLGKPQCCMCGKLNLSVVEGDGGAECQLHDSRWVCSSQCYTTAVEPDALIQAAVVRALEAAANECADYPRTAPDSTEWPHYDDQIEHSQAIIRAIATDPAQVGRIAKGPTT